MDAEDGSGRLDAGGVTRRRLIVGGTLGFAGLVGALDVLRAAAALAETAGGPPPDAVRATMAAFADTIVPGPAGGGDRAPGAVEAGAVEELYDPFYGVAGSYGLLHTDLQAATPRILGRPATFELALPYAERERVIADRILETPAGGSNPLATVYQAAAVLVYLTFVGTARSRAGVDYLGFPPQSTGYHPRHTYALRFRGMTRDGNPS